MFTRLALIVAVLVLGLQAPATADFPVPFALVPGHYATADDGTTSLQPAAVFVDNGHLRWRISIINITTGEFVRWWDVTFGLATDTILPARDWDDDGYDDIAVYRPSTGAWFVLKSDAKVSGVANYSRVVSFGT